ncbi:MAG TPA: hypothetical protein DDW28_05885 [Prevotella sp.]|nr:cytidylate kinase-like family protein [uncultured Prevotella sp.]HBF05625.1 hypothetical protein [Candidatus Segatella violae]
METTKKFVIAINRELGSGGRTIGRKLAEKLNVKFYDKALIKELTKRFNLSVEELEKVKASKRNWWNDFVQSYMNRYNVEDRFNMEANVATTENIFKVESKFLKELAATESCVIAGRSGFFIFRNDPNALRILIQSTMEKRIQRVMEKQGLSEEEAKAVIDKVDKGREKYTKEFSGTSRYDTRNYDLVINVANMTEDATVDLILDYIEKQK